MLMLQGQEVANPYHWVETAVPYIYISKTRARHWLVHTEDEVFYMFRWVPAQHIWFWAEHGIDVCLEDDGEVKVLDGLDARDLRGPQVYGTNFQHEAGPYYDNALEECRQAHMKHNEFVRYEYRLEHSKGEQDALERYMAVKAAMREHTNDTMLFVAGVGANKARWEKKPQEQPFCTEKQERERRRG
jgi:hypothetical protein